MLPKIQSRRSVFLLICLSALVLVAAASLLTWHFLTQPPTPPQASCGTLAFPQDSSAKPHLQQVEQCFYHAYQQCAAMTMQVSQRGVDSGSTSVYWPQKQGNACQIIVESTSYNLVRGDTTSTQTCQGVIPKEGGLLFQGCSTSGDVFIQG